MPYATQGGGPLHTTPYTLSAATPTKILAAQPNRAALLIENPSSIDVFWSENPAVAASGANLGFVLKGGLTPPASFSDITISGDLYAIAASGTPTILVGEVGPF